MPSKLCILCLLWSLLFHHRYQIAYAFLPELHYYGLPIITSKEILKCTITNYKENVKRERTILSPISVLTRFKYELSHWRMICFATSSSMINSNSSLANNSSDCSDLRISIDRYDSILILSNKTRFDFLFRLN